MAIDNRRAVLLLGLLALFGSILFYQFARPFCVDGQAPVFNLDTFLYMQYAKAWAEGHPYRFNAIDPPTTGSTSHFYPALLSLFYLLGFKGLSLLSVLFWMNTVFLIGSIILFWFISKKICPKWPWIPALLFVFSGQAVVGVLGLSEAGLFLFFSLLTWYAALYQRYILQAIALFLLSLIRFEGMIIAVVYGLVWIGSRLLNRNYGDTRTMKSTLWVFLSGSAGVLLVLGLHLCLTGMLTFDSALGKGFLGYHHWLSVINLWIDEIIRFFLEIFGGYEGNVRLYYMIPLVSGIFILIGLLHMPWNRRALNFPNRIEVWWLISIFITILVIAVSGFQGVHYDRYLVWILPLLYFYLVRGISTLSLKDLYKKIIFGIFILYQIICFPIFLQMYLLNAATMQSKIENIKKLSDVLPQKAKVIVNGGSGIKYLHPRWYMISLGGMTVPFFRKCPIDVYEKLKVIQYNPNLHFDYFVQRDEPLGLFRPLIQDSVVVEQSSIVKSTIYVYRFNWDRLLAAAYPIQGQIQDLLKNKKPIDHLDIGYIEDENRCRYQIYSPHVYERLYAFINHFMVDGKNYVDVARGILGMDSFTFKTIPNQDHWLVIRSVFRGNMLCHLFGEPKEIAANMASVQYLTLELNNRYKFEIEMNPFYQNRDGQLFEWAIRIPKEAITGEQTRFSLYGGHYVCDYWLYISNDAVLKTDM